MIRSLLSKLGLLDTLTLKDLVLSESDSATLRALNVFQRGAICNMFQILLFTSTDPLLRKAVIEARDMFINETKSAHNLLPHEKQTHAKKQAPATLPSTFKRFDVL